MAAADVLYTPAVGSALQHTYLLPSGGAVVCDGLSYAEHEGNSLGGALAAAGHATGMTQWPAGRLLCDYLVCQPPVKSHTRVAELGCGLGMTGLVFSALNPDASVLLTDGDEPCVQQAAANAKAAGRASVTAAHLLWGDAAACAALGGPFDVVLGGDLVYGESRGGGLSHGTGKDNVKSLFVTVQALLSHGPGAAFLLGFQRRSVPLSVVLEAAAAEGLAAEVPPGGWCEDLFCERTEEFSDTWQKTVLRFSRATPDVARARAQALLALAEME
jgi:hypothetical protein